MPALRLRLAVFGGFLAMLIVAGCGENPLEFNPGIAGVFQLFRANNQVLPHTIEFAEPTLCGADSGRVELAGGSLVLDDVGRFTWILAYRDVCLPDGGQPTYQDKPFLLAGMFRVVGDKLELYPEADTPTDPSHIGTFQLADIRLTHGGLNLTFRRAVD